MNQNSQNNIDLVKFLSEITNSEEKINHLKNKFICEDTNDNLINLVKLLLNNNVDSLNQISEVINQSTNDGVINLLEIPNIVLKIFGISSKINKDTFSKNNLIDFIKFILLSIVELNVIKVNGDKFNDLLNVSCILLESKLEFSNTDVAKNIDIVENNVKVVSNSCCYPYIKKNRSVTSDVKVNKVSSYCVPSVKKNNVDSDVIGINAKSVIQVDESILIVSTDAKVNKVSNCCVPSVKKNNVVPDVKVEAVVPKVNVVPDVKVEAVVPEVNVVPDVKVEAVVPEVVVPTEAAVPDVKAVVPEVNVVSDVKV
uniref:Uncharacterized protein n=1 Tax=viral metagenome TaxID=1070528 RepID=A0A6C0H0J9_9ZZZZ